MSERYPLYPRLSDEGVKEAEELFVAFKEKMKKIADDVLGELYVNIAPHIESDSWGNYRNVIMAGMQNYGNRKLQAEHDFKKIREQIYKDFRDDIIKDLDQDMLKENEELKRQLAEKMQQLQDAYRRM